MSSKSLGSSKLVASTISASLIGLLEKLRLGESAPSLALSKKFLAKSGILSGSISRISLTILAGIFVKNSFNLLNISLGSVTVELLITREEISEDLEVFPLIAVLMICRVFFKYLIGKQQVHFLSTIFWPL